VQESPALVQLLAQSKDQPFAVIGINSDSGDDVAARIREQGPPWRNVLDGGSRGPVSTQWHVRSWPTMVLLDQEGVIRARVHSVAELVPVVAELLPPK
jgi:hypothetical protein